MLNAVNFTKVEARKLVNDCFRGLAEDVDTGFIPETTEPDREFDYQNALWSDFGSSVKHQLEAGQFAFPIDGMAKSLIEKNGMKWTDLAVASQLDVSTGLARAFLEQLRLFQFRQEDRLSPYLPADPLFAASVSPPAATPTYVMPTVAPDPVGPTVGQVAAKYIQQSKAGWTPKTLRSRQTRMGYLVEFLGADKPISVVSAADVRDFADALCRLGRRNITALGKTFNQKQTECEALQISKATAKLIFVTIKAFFKYAKSKQGFIAVNPAEDVTIDVPKAAKKAKKPRRPFTAAELVKIFTSPVYAGSLSVGRRNSPGKFVFKDAIYWLPILGYYTGARAGELIQLHLDDVDVAGPIPYLAITDENGGLEGTDTHKSVKSLAGIRNVPLHPHVMELGFRKFVETRKKSKHPSKRLFPEISYGKDGQASTVYSKRFAFMLDKLELIDPALVFHSFRHNSEDAFRNAMLPQQIIDRIIGHTDDSTSAGYGEGVWLETAYDAVQRMKLLIDLTKVLGNNDTK